MGTPTYKQIARTAVIMLLRFSAMIAVLICISMMLTSCYVLQTIIQTPIDFGEPDFVYDFSEANISEGDLYAGHTVTLAENVEYKDSTLYLYTKYHNQFYHFWDGDQFCYHSTGWVDFEGINTEAYGTWETEITLPEESDTWPAFWALHERHYADETSEFVYVDSIKDCTIYVPNPNPIKINWVVLYDSEFIGYVVGLDSISVTLDRTIKNMSMAYINASIDNIIPEVDAMEVLSNGKIRHTVHHGYSMTEYAIYNDGMYITTPIAGHKYLFAVTVTPEGYTFYIDRIKTYEYMNSNATSDYPLMWILNNAIQPDVNLEINSTMKIHSFKYYSLKN